MEGGRTCTNGTTDTTHGCTPAFPCTTAQNGHSTTLFGPDPRRITCAWNRRLILVPPPINNVHRRRLGGRHLQDLIGEVQLVPEVCRFRDRRNFPIHLHIHIHLQPLLLLLPLLFPLLLLLLLLLLRSARALDAGPLPVENWRSGLGPANTTKTTEKPFR